MSTYEFLYGRHSVLRAILNPRRAFQKVFMQNDLPHSAVLDEIRAAAQTKHVELVLSGKTELERKFSLSGKPHQGVVGVSAPYPYTELIDLLSTTPTTPYFIVVLDHIQDPHNVGALIRSAELAGAHAVIVPSDRSCLITPTVVKTSAGACELLPIVQVINLNQTIDILKQHWIQVVGLETGPEHLQLFDQDLTGPIALVIGSEGPGISQLTRKRCDSLIEIPMQGKLESLNASVAGGIAMFEILRQRRAPTAR